MSYQIFSFMYVAWLYYGSLLYFTWFIHFQLPLWYNFHTVWKPMWLLLETTELMNGTILYPYYSGMLKSWDSD